MYLPEKLLNDQEYQEYHTRDLTLGGQSDLNRPVVAQLCGHDPEMIVQAGRRIQGYCDAIGQVFRVVSVEVPLIQQFLYVTLNRSQPRLPSRSSTRRPLWCLPSGPERLATSRKYR
jgi:hypothetical protein